MNDTTSDADHPAHYNQHPAGIECIDVIEVFSFNIGNAIKYLWRALHAGQPIEDLQKAAWYVNREVERLITLMQEEEYANGDITPRPPE